MMRCMDALLSSLWKILSFLHMCMENTVAYFCSSSHCLVFRSVVYVVDQIPVYGLEYIYRRLFSEDE